MKPGVDVITEGDLNATFFYIVKPALLNRVCHSFAGWFARCCNMQRSGKFDVIQSGACCCSSASSGSQSEPRKEHRRFPGQTSMLRGYAYLSPTGVGQLKPGNSFGEPTAHHACMLADASPLSFCHLAEFVRLALIYTAPRAATVKALVLSCNAAPLSASSFVASGRRLSWIRSFGSLTGSLLLL